MKSPQKARSQLTGDQIETDKRFEVVLARAAVFAVGAERACVEQ